MRTIGRLGVVIFAHPQGCRGYLLVDLPSKEALALDVHLDDVREVAARVQAEGWTLRYVVDSHTHADHPSGAGALAALLPCTRVAHEAARHHGVTLHPQDGAALLLGGSRLVVRHAPGHTPDHLVLVAEGALFSGDSLFIGGVARTDFLGGDAGVLFDSIHALLATLPDETVLFPGHDYQQRRESTLGEEKRGNPWLRLPDRDTFARNLTAHPPPRPANMDDLLRLNREGVAIPATMSAADAAQVVAHGGATSVIDVRSGAEFEDEHIPGARLIPLDQLAARVAEVRATPAPRLLLCQSGARAATAKQVLEKLPVAGLTVVQGGMTAYVQAGGSRVKGKAHWSLERQVRIVAGLLVLAGVLLGVWVHRGFLGLAALVGAGLVFAGVTNWCGLAALLGRLPWNQASGHPGAPPAGGSCAAGAPGGCAAGAPPAGVKD